MRIKSKTSLQIGILLTFIVLVGFGCNFSYSVGVPKEPTAADAQKLVKETMADFTAALASDDFEALRRKTAKSFQQEYTAQDIRGSFGVFLAKKNLAVPLFQEAQKTNAEFENTPKMRLVDKIYYLELKGKSVVKEQALNFNLEYVREDGQWKLIRFQVKT